MGIIKDYFQRERAKSELKKAFKNAGLIKHYKNGDKDISIYPKIHEVNINQENKTLRYTFTLMNGIDPKELRKKEFVFQQHFGKNIELEGDLKKFVLTVHQKPLNSDKVKYVYSEILEIIKEKQFSMPIVAGKDKNGIMRIYDATNNPNLLIFGEPGGGKSSIQHVILTTLIQMHPADQLQIYLADFKMSEFNVYEEVKHVKSVSYLTKDLSPALAHIKSELTIRGELLKQHGVRHINKLPKGIKPPYIVLAIDEFVMIKDEVVMSNLLQIASLGRAYGIYLVLSMQRPSHSILSTDVRGVLSVRMGFRTVDKRNALIGETPGSEKISKEEPGKFLLNLEELVELKAPFLDEDETEKILVNYKSSDWKNHNYKGQVTTKPKQSKQISLPEIRKPNDNIFL
ncbi:FtsK/SpoIIIE domain-containing protein [Peribacillus loiseleuriae]|uniref:FtsK/SpoIIIE domain-containing protein n=1 Tax=Peribacillus loiseleuriae TaxID=1679170 RepID=UPI003CFEA0A4